ncbi:nitroreductase family protein [Priestia megaterium]|uniref:nitroreductase family protein n=1 Tax=Priestia megaterium TaxID=1404 RepID=UPI000BFBBA68|nr:nitroreductase family protein [Priestia megaterium]PGX23283.1 nitroreductase family protein [Priestia megaterium]
MEFNQLIQARHSVNQFDPNGTISREELESIIEAATLAPSSYNLQHWRFLVVDDKDKKLKLKSAAYDQQKIEDAAAAIVVLGNLKAHEDAQRIADDLSEKGYLPEQYKENVINQINGLYSNESMQRDEAIRGSSLAAMTLMLAAKDKGFGTCPMIGFDPARVQEEFNIPENLIPVMIITIGPENDPKAPRKFRFEAQEITTYNGF